MAIQRLESKAPEPVSPVAVPLAVSLPPPARALHLNLAREYCGEGARDSSSNWI
ncbi:hypothetical protein DPEC_G00041110 [Dallia pectoralis]|uniref:Uncharacterized protein n=1 Tax=Dallia pectoralis TaxID=75939 RepID=A0ACC2HF60_DALPE|nr:hypothetical protein DPEC_G00041110 [Dallia pectoralis]